MPTKTNPTLLACLATAALLAPCASLAQDAGWYGGASLGSAMANIDSGRITTGLNNQGLVVSGLSERDNDTAYKLFGGYQVNRYFGLEASWFHLGTAGYTATTTPAGTLSGDVRMRGLSLDAVGTYALNERFSVLGRVGVVQTRTRGTFAATGAVTNPYGATSTSESDTGIKFGAGVAWRLNDQWSARAELERFRVNDSVGNKGHIDLVSIGLVYRFGGAPLRSRGS